MAIAAGELLVLGGIIVLSILSKAALERLGLPDLLGYLLIGFSLDLTILTGAQGPVLMHLLAAVVGKGLGSFLPIARRMRPASALVFAVALIPRSEITLIVMERGLDLGVVSQETFGVVVAVVALTMVGVPLALRGLLPH